MNAQLFKNNGAEVLNNAYIRVLGDVSNDNTGVIETNGTFVIDSNIINNANLEGDGLYKVSGNWENNLTFNSGTSKVILEGINQLITGTAISSYYDLELTGSGIKTQTIDSYVTDSLILNDRELATDIYTMFVTNTDIGAISRTTGFVSSLGNGCLSRATNINDIYLFPVGSSLITTRYRPVEIIPASANSNTYTVRLANNDATIDGYDRALHEIGICELNPLFYHKINRTAGIDVADITIYYDEINDGTWEGIAQWKIIPTTQWEDIGPVTSVSASPLNSLTKTAWNDFSTDPYILTIPSLTVDLGNDTTICAGNTVTLDAGIGDSYLWSDNSTGQTLNVSASGIYSVTVTDINGCTGTDTVTVTENPNPTPAINGTLSICTGSSTVLDAGAYTSWLWSTTDVTQTITVTSGGNYSVTITDANGCTGTDNVTVTETPNPTPAITGTLDFCTGSSTLLDAGAYTNWLWSTTDVTQTINVTSGGNYSVTVTDANGCTGTDAVTVTENANPTPAIIGTLDFCTGSSTLLDAGVYTSWLWSTTDVSQTLTVTSGGNYSVTVTDVNGCTGTDTVTVTENANPTPSINGTLSFCTGSSTLLDAGAYTSWQWSTTDVTQTITVTSAGNYSVTVTDANGCTGTDAVTVTENSNLTPSISGTFSFCTGNSTVLDAGVYTSWLWSTTDVAQTVNVTSGGNYSVTVTDANGCTGTDAVTVTENANPTPAISGTLDFCTGSSTLLDAGVYTSWLWSTTDVSQTLTVTSGGNYSVTVTDANGCTGTDTVTVTENLNPTPSISGTLSFCTGSSTILDAGSYASWLWSTTDVNQTITVTSGGTYSVTVTDANGCAGTDAVTVTENSNSTPSISGALSFCADGSTILDAGSYTSWLWSTTDVSQTITVTSGGSYSVTVTDANGCTGTDAVTVTENPNPTPSISGTLFFCTGSSTVLDAGSYASWLWSTTDVSQTITVTSGGSYSVTVTDANGCTGMDGVTVTENSVSIITDNISICNGDSVFINDAWQSTSGTYYDTLITTLGCDSIIITNLTVYNVVNTTITPVDPVCENDLYFYLDASPDSGIWSGPGIIGTTTGMFDPGIAGTGSHEIIYMISGSCGSSDTTYIEVHPVPVAAITGDNEIMYGGSGTLMAAGGNFYQWLSSDNIACADCQYIEVSPSGLTEYCVEVTNDYGCTDTTCVFVYVNKDCGELFIPNAFSPNGDGYNDVLYVRGECINTMYLAIYDRWGELVFETADQNKGWDGRYKGKNLDDAVFMYYLKVSFTNLETEELKGNISLIR